MKKEDFEELQWLIAEGISDRHELRRLAQGMQIGLELSDDPEKLKMYIDMAYKRHDEMWDLEKAIKKRDDYWESVANSCVDNYPS